MTSSYFIPVFCSNPCGIIDAASDGNGEVLPPHLLLDEGGALLLDEGGLLLLENIPGELSVSVTASVVAGGTATITITRAVGSDGTVTCLLNTFGGTAVAGTHYTAITDQLITLEDGETSTTVNLLTFQEEFSSSTATADVRLSQPTGGADLAEDWTDSLTITGLSVSSGPSLPTVGGTDSSVGLAAWANAGNITANDGTSASAASITLGTSTVLLVGTGITFAGPVPNDATIVGIQVIVDRSSTGDRCRDTLISLYLNGVVIGDNKADTGTQWPASLTEKTYGGASDDWGAGLTGADVNDPDFGIAIQCEKNVAGAGGASVDYASVKIWYTT